MDEREGAAASAEVADEVVKSDEEIWKEIVDGEPADGPEKQEEDPPLEVDPDPAEPSEAEVAEEETPDAAEDASEGTNDVKEETDADRMKRLEHEVNSGRGRVSALQRKLDRMTAENERLKKKEEAGAEPNEERKAKLDKAVEEYGDALAPLVEEMGAISASQKREAEDAKSQREMNEREMQDLFQEQSKVFLQEHPDGFKFLDDNRDAFFGWVDDQPKAIRDMAERNKETLISGQEVAYLVSAYKAAHAPDVPAENPEKERLQERRKKQLEGAQSARSTTVKAHSSEPEDPEALFKYLVAQDRKRGASY